MSDSPSAPEPVWAVAAVDQLIARMKESLGADYQFDGVDTVMVPLGEPAEDATPEQLRQWDRVCDNCGRYCPSKFYVGFSKRQAFGATLVITYGSCPRCAGQEP